MFLNVISKAKAYKSSLTRSKSKLKDLSKFNNLRVSSVLIVAFTSIFISGCIEGPKTYYDRKNSLTLEDIKPTPSVVLKVGYDNAVGEPFDLGMKRWKDELEKLSHGTMTLDLYPESKLGNQGKLLQLIDQGQAVATISDGALYYSKGMYDMGIVFGPYLFKNWDEAFRLASSKWYKDQSKLLAKKTGYRIISSNWAYGQRHLLTRKPVTTLNDLQGLRIRVANNDIQKQGFAVLGAEPVALNLTEARQALRTGKIDGMENPLSHLYGGGYYKEAPYLLMSGHIYNFTNIIVSEKWWQSLNSAQRRILRTSCERASKFFNIVNDAYEYEVLKKLKQEGVTITYPSAKFVTEANAKARSFYNLPMFTKVWQRGLYYKILGAKSVPWSYYQAKRFIKKTEGADDDTPASTPVKN